MQQFLQRSNVIHKDCFHFICFLNKQVILTLSFRVTAHAFNKPFYFDFLSTLKHACISLLVLCTYGETVQTPSLTAFDILKFALASNQNKNT